MSEYCTCYQIQGHYYLVNNVSLVFGWLGALGLSILCNFQVSFCLKDSFIMCNSYSQGDGGVRSAQGWTLLMFWLWCPLVVVSCLSQWRTLPSFLFSHFPDHSHHSQCHQHHLLHRHDHCWSNCQIKISWTRPY